MDARRDQGGKVGGACALGQESESAKTAAAARGCGGGARGGVSVAGEILVKLPAMRIDPRAWERGKRIDCRLTGRQFQALLDVYHGLLEEGTLTGHTSIGDAVRGILNRVALATETAWARPATSLPVADGGALPAAGSGISPASGRAMAAKIIPMRSTRGAGSPGK